MNTIKKKSARSNSSVNKKKRRPPPIITSQEDDHVTLVKRNRFNFQKMKSFRHRNFHSPVSVRKTWENARLGRNEQLKKQDMDKIESLCNMFRMFSPRTEASRTLASIIQSEKKTESTKSTKSTKSSLSISKDSLLCEEKLSPFTGNTTSSPAIRKNKTGCAFFTYEGEGGEISPVSTIVGLDELFNRSFESMNVSDGLDTNHPDLDLDIGEMKTVEDGSGSDCDSFGNENEVRDVFNQSWFLYSPIQGQSQAQAQAQAQAQSQVNSTSAKYSTNLQHVQPRVADKLSHDIVQRGF